jgi:hypothetical protein
MADSQRTSSITAASAVTAIPTYPRSASIAAASTVTAIPTYPRSASIAAASTVTVLNTFFDDAAVITNPTPTLSIAFDVTDSAAITNPEPTFVTSFDVVDAAVITSILTGGTTRTTNVVDSGRLTDNSYTSRLATTDVLETAILDDIVSFGPRTLDVLETAVITNIITPTVSRIQDVLDTAVLNDAVYLGLGVDVLDTAVLNDIATPSRSVTVDVLETAVLNDIVTISGTLIEDVLETGAITSILSSVLTAVTDVLEEGFISSEVYDYSTNLSGVTTGGVVWTANTVNWAMSRYTNLFLTGIAGNFAVSADGLFNKSEDYADAVIEPGRLMFDSPRLKSVDWVYAIVENVLPLQMEVTADVDGEAETYIYGQMERGASSPRSVRFELGQGFRSTYYKLKFLSTGYVKMYNCVPVVNGLSRSI